MLAYLKNKEASFTQTSTRYPTLFTTHVCSLCADAIDEKGSTWLCHSKEGRSCFFQHMHDVLEDFNAFNNDGQRVE
jgi:hypothetical protein